MSAADGSGVLPDLAASRLYAAVVSDILDDLGHRDHTLEPAIRPLRPGEVILVAAGGSARAACWGELFSAAARARGARGTLIDGYCRDARRIAALGYPVW